jgi:hypothetical protein
MPQYPRKLSERHGQEMARLRRQMRRQQAHTASIDSGWPLAALPAVIASVTGSGPAVTVTAYLNGAAVATGPYQVLASYTPAVNDNVLVIPVGVQQTYVILGKMQ